MKKFLSVLLCGALCIASLFAFAACGNKNELPDFADCKIGYQLEVYPKVAFDYKISEDCIVHIESITATLTAKNVINDGDVLDEPFYPYEVTLAVKGKVNGTPPSDNDGTPLWISLSIGSFPRLIIDQQGRFESTCTAQPRENTVVTFIRISN